MKSFVAITVAFMACAVGNFFLGVRGTPPVNIDFKPIICPAIACQPCFYGIPVFDARGCPTCECKDPCLSLVPGCPPDKVCKVSPVTGQPVCKCKTYCPLVFKPVCGSNGKTYSNECKLKVAACLSSGSGIIKVSNGPCNDPCKTVKCPAGKHCEIDFTTKTPKCVCPRFCPMIYLPVCGSDQMTYGNDCQLNIKTCQTNGKVTKVHDGPCPRKYDLD